MIVVPLLQHSQIFSLDRGQKVLHKFYLKAFLNEEDSYSHLSFQLIYSLSMVIFSLSTDFIWIFYLIMTFIDFSLALLREFQLWFDLEIFFTLNEYGVYLFPELIFCKIIFLLFLLLDIICFILRHRSLSFYHSQI